MTTPITHALARALLDLLPACQQTLHVRIATGEDTRDLRDKLATAEAALDRYDAEVASEAQASRWAEMACWNDDLPPPSRWWRTIARVAMVLGVALLLVAALYATQDARCRTSEAPVQLCID